jgi:hemerythrin-like domain-containing protein
MLNMTNYQRRHSEIGEVLSAISGKLDPQQIADGGALELCADVSRLVGMISVHFESEDESLYPKLLASGQPGVTETVKKFQNETGGLKSDVEMFFLKWSSPIAITEKVGEFVDEGKSIVEALTRRIQRESTELYPLAVNI